MKNKNGYKEIPSTHRVITMLDRREMEFMDKLGKDALFSTGHKLSYNEILKGLLDLVMETGVSAERVDSAAAFKEKVLRQIRATMQEQEKKGGQSEIPAA